MFDVFVQKITENNLAIFKIDGDSFLFDSRLIFTALIIHNWSICMQTRQL